MSYPPALRAKKCIPTTEHPQESGIALFSPNTGVLPSQNIHGPTTMLPVHSPSPAAALNPVQTSMPTQLIRRAPRSILGWKDHRPTFSTQWKWSISEPSRMPGVFRLGRKICASSLIPQRLLDLHSTAALIISS